MPRKIIRYGYNQRYSICNIETTDQDPWYQIDRAAAKEEIERFIDKVNRGDITSSRNARIQIDFASIEAEELAKEQAEEDAIAAKEQAKLDRYAAKIARIEAKRRERKMLRELEKELSKLLSTKEVEIRVPKFHSINEFTEFVRKLNAGSV